MKPFPPTIILRHRKENLKKCSLRGLEKRSDLRFYRYPWNEPKPDLSSYIVLAIDAPLLSIKDQQKGICLIDSTWRYSEKMLDSLPLPFEKRSLPSHFQTSYPRKQEDCVDPTRGLASVEALYLAYLILGRDPAGLLDHFYWKELFLESVRKLKI